MKNRTADFVAISAPLPDECCQVVCSLGVFINHLIQNGMIDSYEVERNTKSGAQTVTFKVCGIHSNDRYELSSLKGSNMHKQYLREQGRIERRSKLRDFYCRVSYDCQTCEICVQFTSPGHQRLVNETGLRSEPIRISDSQDTELQRFKDRIVNALEYVNQSLEETRDQLWRTLDRLTTPAPQ